MYQTGLISGIVRTFDLYFRQESGQKFTRVDFKVLHVDSSRLRSSATANYQHFGKRQRENGHAHGEKMLSSNIQERADPRFSVNVDANICYCQIVLKPHGIVYHLSVRSHLKMCILTL